MYALQSEVNELKATLAALQSELIQERALRRLADVALREAQGLLIASQREVAKLEGQKRGLLATVEAKKAIIATLQDAPY